MNASRLKIVFLALLFVTFLPGRLFAAELHFDSSANQFASGQDFVVSVLLATDHESLNAVSGAITYPQDLVELKEVRDGNSNINFWIQPPATTTPGTITFSGITPGGLMGDKEYLFSLVFHPLKSGTGTIKFNNIQVLKNDGKGTQTSAGITPFNLSILGVTGSASSTLAKIVDRSIPEYFSPSIGQSSNVFDGKYFLVFSTQDKESGVSHYEVKEGYFGTYHIAESPYVLERQNLDRDIYVKAVDRSGNQRIVVLNALHPNRLYELAIIFAILIVVGGLWYLGEKIWQKFTK